LAHHCCIDHPTADRRCSLGSLGWTASATLESPAAAPHRVRGSADPCTAVCLDRRSTVSCWTSTARWHQRGDSRCVHGTRHCRPYAWDGSVQSGSRHHWDRVRTWCCAQHCTLWGRRREL